MIEGSIIHSKMEETKMSDYTMEVVHGARAPVLADALLARVHELNRDYVELLVAERALPALGMPGEDLPHKVIDALAVLDAPARTALSRCPYVLFNFGFDDDRFWLAALGDAEEGAQS